MNPATDSSAHRGPRRKVELKSSRTLELPCAITQQNTMAALFAAPSAELRKLLPSRRLKLVETHPGTSVFCVACTDYARVDGLEPYLEVALLVPVRYGARVSVPLLPLLAPQLFPDAGYYVHRTFVSSAE